MAGARSGKQLMARKLDERRIVIASHNSGKVVEIGALLRPYRVEAIAAQALGLPEPEETGDSFEANAALKAHAAAQAARLPALADDSGLVGRRISPRRWRGSSVSSAAAIAPRCLLRCWRSLGPTATSRAFAARSPAAWYGRRAAIAVSAMTRCLFRRVAA